MSTEERGTSNQETELTPVDEANNVTIVFADGSELDVSFVLRFVDGKWAYACLIVESEFEDAHDYDDVVIQTNEIRYIHSEDVGSPSAETSLKEECRVHYSDNKPDIQQIWKAE